MNDQFIQSVNEFLISTGYTKADNIYEKTEDMSFARYPFSSKEDKQFYINSTKNEVIDLEILSDQIVYIYKLLNLRIFYSQLILIAHIRQENYP